MASADDPAAAAVAVNIFNEDEDLLDDEDDEDSEDESASSVADRPLRSSVPGSTALVTVAVPGVPIMRVDQEHHQQQQQEMVIVKKPPPPDESRKLFQRLWTDEDEIELLQGFLEYTAQRGGPNSSSHHHHDTTAFYDQIRSKFQLDFNKNQLVEKLRRLKKKYRNVINKFGSGKEYAFKSPHEQITFEISSKIWGNVVPNFNGASAIRSFPAPIDEDDDEPNNPNFIDCFSPNPNGIDVNSKTPRPRKRNRAGAVKMEEKPHPVINSNNTFNNQPPSVPVTPLAAAPVMSMGPMGMGMGMGIAGSFSNVIEEAVKSCLSPVLKELLSNSSNSNPNSNGLFGGQGFGFALSPMPLGLFGAVGGDKMADNKWKKQQILELEVFSKRLELMQDQINVQLQELRSPGN